MKKIYSICLMTIAMLFVGNLSANALEQDDQGIYQINTVKDLQDFADVVNFGDDVAACAVLNADLDMSGVEVYYPIGTVEFPYTGTFDGQGHTLNNLVIDSNSTGVTEYVGAFGAVGGGAHIKNLIVAGEEAFIGADRLAAGIVGGTIGKGLVTIENCGNEAFVYVTNENAAGILGVCWGSEADIVITNCYNTGEIAGGKECGAISGWVGDRAVITNCWNTGTITSGADTGKPFCRFNGAEFVNCWDIQGAQANIGVITEADKAGMATGEFCFKVLNNTLTENIGWYQKLDVDAHPYPFASRGTVYAVGDLYCDGTSKSGATTYSNTNSSTRDPHNFEHGACSRCDEFDPSYMTADADGYYNISTSAELYWFARYIDTEENLAANARLTADIVYEKNKQIGSLKHYMGIFDGQEHKVTVALDGKSSVALFGYLEDATIQNLWVDGTITATGQFAAGIAVEAYGATTIKNCVAAADITSTLVGADGTAADGTHGGILAVGHGDLVIENCAFVGTLNAELSFGSGGIVGYKHEPDQGMISNCYVSGTLNLALGNNNIVIARNCNNIFDCWVSSPNAELYNPNNYTTVFEPEIVSTGEFCYQNLNGTSTVAPVWYQTINKDAYPVPFPSHGIVYVAGEQNCDGTPKPGNSQGYSNNPSGARDPHTFADGLCSECGEADPDYMHADAEGFFNLGNAKELAWFAKYTKSEETKTANARLTADINYTGTEKIGMDRLAWGGVFDGQGHTITVNFNNEENRTALFDLVQDGTIQNLIVAGKVETTGQYAAGLAVEVTGTSTIKNVVVNAEIISYYEGDGTHGGIVAIGKDNLTIENCAFNGMLMAELSEGSGGIMGYTHSGRKTVIKNTMVAGELILLEGVNNEAICRNNPKLINCWISWDASLYGANNKVRFFEIDGEMKDGSLCFALNDYTSENAVWRQEIDKDDYPMPFSKGAIVYAEGTVGCDGNMADLTYNNTSGTPVWEDHHFVDGMCDGCENAYQIATADDLLNFSFEVASGNASTAYAELLSDIDLADQTYLPIGGRTDEGGTPYSGTFDGKGFRIKNMVINTDVNNQGLFGVVADGAVIKNVIVDASSSVTVSGGDSKGYAAGIVGATVGTGELIIENCGNEANVTVDGPNAAGILGVSDLSQMDVQIINCYNTGDIQGNRESATISGWLSNNSVMTNCWNSGQVLWGQDGNNSFYRNGAAQAINCYNIIPNQATTITADQIASGELAWLLNEGKTENVVWFQTIDEDAHPVFDASHGVVAKVGDSFVNATDGVESVETVKNAPAAIYSINGAKLTNVQKGINIIRMTDGSVRKVLVK